MMITLNGKAREIPAGTTLQALVAQTAKDPQTVVVEMDQQIIDRSLWPITPCKENAVLELVTFVGGG